MQMLNGSDGQLSSRKVFGALFLLISMALLVVAQFQPAYENASLIDLAMRYGGSVIAGLFGLWLFGMVTATTIKAIAEATKK